MVDGIIIGFLIGMLIGALFSFCFIKILMKNGYVKFDVTEKFINEIWKKKKS